MRETLLKLSGNTVQYLKNIKFKEKEINSMFAYAIEGGRRLRPALVSLGTEAVRGNPEKVIQAAAAIELVHKSTLIHDDIIDKDEYRRGKKTLHSVFGVENGILMGNLLNSIALNLIGQLSLKHDYEKIFKCHQSLTKTIEIMNLGEIKDCLFEEQDNVDINDYLQQIYQKTACLLESSLQIGAILGGGKETEINKLSLFGSNLGLAFQIRNDVNNFNLEEKTGRKLGFEILKKKKTCPIIYTFQEGNEPDIRKLDKLVDRTNYSLRDTKSILNIFENNGAFKYCEKLIEEYTSKAKNSLIQLTDNEAKKILLSLADYIQTNDYWYNKSQ